mmetsp:Transcript_41895/g.100222  ORF Transcript_41895/g.100222 Transcript_41895/m.100222 type:complete len:437 (+) Transcript_41895:150-1460(+)
MPGKRSADARERRRQRARDSGYLVPKPRGCTFIAVPDSVASRVKEVASSLSLHSAHNELTCSSLPTARQATRAARELLPHSEYKAAMRKHDIANLAKHDWETPSPPPCGGAPPCCERSFSTVATQTEFPLRAEAPDFLPQSVGCCPVPADSSDNYDCLFQVQNSTIALLAGGLDQVLPSFRKIREIEKRLENLRGSLSATVDDRIRPLRADIVSQCVSATEVALDKSRSETLNQCLSATKGVLVECTTDMASQCLKSTAALVNESAAATMDSVRSLLARVPLPAPAAPANGVGFDSSGLVQCEPDAEADYPSDTDSLDCLASGLLAIGDSALISGLVSRPELNGQIAVVIEAFDGSRYRVKTDDGEFVRVRPAALLPCPPPPLLGERGDPAPPPPALPRGGANGSRSSPSRGPSSSKCTRPSAADLDRLVAEAVWE